MNRYLVITADNSQCYVSVNKKALPTKKDCWEYIEHDLKEYMGNEFYDAIMKHKDIETSARETLYWSTNCCFANNADFQCEYEIVDMLETMKGEEE